MFTMKAERSFVRIASLPIAAAEGFEPSVLLPTHNGFRDCRLDRKQALRPAATERSGE